MTCWPLVPLAEVISHRKQFVTVEPDVTYTRCRVQTSARGIVLRDRIPGSHLKTKRQQVCRAGEFLVAEIDAKVGGYGIVPDTLHGAIVSSHYFLFQIDKDRLSGRFLGWFSKTNNFRRQVRPRGSTNYSAIRPRDLLQYRIPLPPLDEQRHVVAKLDNVNSLLSVREGISDSAEDEAQAMLLSAFRQVVKNAPRKPMGKVAPLVRRQIDVHPDCSYPEVGIRSFGRGIFHKHPIMGIDVGSKKLYSIYSGDLLFNIVFAWEGAVAVARPDDHGRVGSHRFLTCVPNQKLATPEFLRFYFLTPEGLRCIGEASPGGAGRNRTLGIRKLEGIEVPVPSLPSQCWFNRIQELVRSAALMKALIAVDSEELSAGILQTVFGKRANDSD